jgi:hypothetical protein
MMLPRALAALARPLFTPRTFFRAWLGRGRANAAQRRPRRPQRPASRRPGAEPLESREAAGDLLGPVQTGLGVSGLALLAPPLLSPLDAGAQPSAPSFLAPPEPAGATVGAPATAPLGDSAGPSAG